MVSALGTSYKEKSEKLGLKKLKERREGLDNRHCNCSQIPDRAKRTPDVQNDRNKRQGRNNTSSRRSWIRYPVRKG